MRNYFQNLNIVQAMLVFREGDLLDYVIPYHLEHADKILILLDNYDSYTEQKVLRYQMDNPEKIIVKYSSHGHFESPVPGQMNARFKLLEGHIREQLLDFVRDENSKKKIDVLTWFDADEIPTIHVDKILNRLLNQQRLAVRTRYIDVIGDFHHFTVRKILPHCRIFKYNEKFSTIPMEGRAMLKPLSKGQTYVDGFFTVHLPDYNLDKWVQRQIYKRRLYRGLGLWESDKDVRLLTNEEVNQIINTEPICPVEEYIQKKTQSL